MVSFDLGSSGDEFFRNYSKRYGLSGNSYLAVVEFNPRVKARSLLVFGQSTNPESPHFLDQAELYSKRQYKPSLFESKEIKLNSERSY